MMSQCITRTLTPTVSNIIRITSRGNHFLAGVPLKKRGVDGNVAVESLENKVLLLYFSAGWCGTCKVLTPKLKKFYEGLKENEQSAMEVVWVSRDKEADHQIEYYEKAMPAWNYVPFGDKNVKLLQKNYGVKVIPALKLVNNKGEVLSENVRADVEGCIKDKSSPSDCFSEWKKLY